MGLVTNEVMCQVVWGIIIVIRETERHRDRERQRETTVPRTYFHDYVDKQSEKNAVCVFFTIVFLPIRPMMHLPFACP